MDQDLQREYFARAAQLLGGNEATARVLNISSRSLRSFISGERRLHSGILQDIATALLAHAEACRTLERNLSPAFSSNLTPANLPPLHDGRPAKLMDKLGRAFNKARAAGKAPESWLFSHSFYEQLVEEVGHLLDGREIYGLPWESTKDENLHERGFVLECDGE